MFAILSWVQESGFLDKNLGFTKGLLAAFFGYFLYKLLPSKIDDWEIFNDQDRKKWKKYYTIRPYLLLRQC